MKRLPTGIALGVAALTAAAAPVALTGSATATTQTAGHAAAVETARASVAQAAAQLGLGAGQKLVVKDVVTDADGTQHLRYERSFNGLRVVGGDLIVEKSAAGATKAVRWNATGNAKAMPAVTAAVSKVTAEATAARGVGYAAKEKSSELVVLMTATGPRLAYDVVTTGTRADQTPQRTHTYVDAATGRTLKKDEDIHTGTGNSQFSGQVSITTTRSGSTYQLKDAIGHSVIDVKNKSDILIFPATGSVMTDADDVWGNGTVSDRNTAGVDALFGAQTTFNYYKNVLGRNGIKNDGKGAVSRVHYGNAYVNAFWDGKQMTYGDGTGNANPLTEIDVAGHEMSHGVTENSAGLDYSGDAGGLNEATSDIFGTMVEWYAGTSADPGDYLIGEEIDLNGDGTPLRYMDKPSKDGASQDCWTTGTKNLDPHYSSGPLNHWFFMASEGSGAKTVNGVSYNSPTCGGSAAVTGTGRDAVAKIWYRTLSTKLTSGSTYADARNGAIASAKELYGAGSSQCTAVKTAFDAIAVPAGSQTC